MRLLGWIVGLPLALGITVFAVANRHGVALELWPLPWSIQVPVYLAVLGPLGVGMVIGALAATLSSLPARRQARLHRRRADSLARQLDAAEAKGQAVMIPSEPII